MERGASNIFFMISKNVREKKNLHSIYAYSYLLALMMNHTEFF